MFCIKASHINICLVICFLFLNACGSGKKAQKTTPPPIKKEGKVRPINGNQSNSSNQEKVDDLTENKPAPTIFTPKVNELETVKKVPETHSLPDTKAPQIVSSLNVAVMLP